MRLGMLLAGALPAASALAFSDPAVYPESVALGGGGGRWFTGSPAEGYGCDVCHLGGEPTQLGLQGLPLEGFVPGTPYEVILLWPPLPGVALIAEFTDELRQGAGTIALPRLDALKPPELCSAEEGGALPSAVTTFDAGRQLVSVVDCGAQYLRFQWTAPALAPIPSRIWFSLGFVSSNEDALPGGDGVTMVRQPLALAGTSLGTRTVTEGCSVSAPNGGWSWLSAVALALGGAAALRAVAGMGRRGHG